MQNAIINRVGRTLTTSKLFWRLVCVLLLMPSLQNVGYAASQVRISESPLSRKIQQSIVTAVFEDRNGFLWIGTQHGLYKFNGSSMSEFSASQHGNNRIPASEIKGISQDSNNRILVATFGGGLLAWDDATNSFLQLADSNIDETRYLSDLVVSADGRVWVGGKGGLFQYDRNSQTQGLSFIEYKPRNEEGEFSAISSDGYGNIYVAYGKNLYKIQQSSKFLINIYSGDNSSQHNGQITALAFDHSNQIYMGTSAGEVLSLNLTENVLKKAVQLGDQTAVSVVTMLFYKDVLWIGTNDGLVYSSPAPSVVTTYSQSNSGLPDNHILTLTPGAGFLWVGTYRGLSTLSLVPFEAFNKQNSGVFNDVLAFSEDSENRFWVGTFNGLYLFNEQSGKHTRYKYMLENGSLADQRIMTMAFKGDHLWLGFQKNGLQILNTKTLEIDMPAIPFVEHLEVTKILHTESGETWIATFNRGLFRIKDGEVTSYLTSGLLPEPTITILFQLQSGQIIASSEQVIYLQNSDSLNFSPLKLTIDDISKPPFILAISQSPTGQVWIGTKDQGLLILSDEAQLERAQRPMHVSSSRSDPISTVYEIQFDEEGNAWCSTQNGIIQLDPSADILARFSTSDGLQGQDFNFGASYTDSLGKIYFGGSNGYNRFHPNQVVVTSIPPRLLITNLAISKDSEIVDFDATTLNEIQLTYKDYFVQFEFSVLDFKDPERNQYRYILDGFDHDWIENGTRNTATYTSLPPGDYVLRVQGANSAGVWNREGLSLAVKVFPPPWRTWWAYTLYAIFLAFLLWLGKRAYDSYVIEKRAREMALVMIASEERADDEMQEQLEIHDDLVKSVYRHSVSTLNLVGDVLSIRGGQLIDENAREVIAQSIERVQALALLEECLFYQNEVLLADLNKYTNILVSNLLQKSATDEQHITTINEVSARPLPIEQASPLAIALYELLENAIVHAFDESSEANYIHVILATEAAGTQDAGHHRLTVQDDGAGIPSNIDPLSSHTPGFVIVASMAQKLSAELSFAFRNGTLVSMVFPQQEAR